MNAIASQIVNRLSALLAAEPDRYAKHATLAGQRMMNWDEEKHPRDQAGRFSEAGHELVTVPESRGVPAFQAEVRNRPDGTAAIHRTEGEWKDRPLVTMHGSQVKTFLGDLAGKVTSDTRTNDDSVNKVLDQKANFISRGNDGLAFDTGDGNVVKAGSDLAYHWSNGIRQPGEGAKRTKEAAELNNKLRAEGVPGLLQQTVIEHDGRTFLKMPKLTIPEKLTRQQLDQVQKTVTELNNRGYAIGDELQPGLDSQGNAYIYDTGSLSKSGQFGIDDDMGHLARLFEKNGEKFDNPDAGLAYESQFAEVHDYLKRSPRHGAAHWQRMIDRLEEKWKPLDNDTKSFLAESHFTALAQLDARKAEAEARKAEVAPAQSTTPEKKLTSVAGMQQGLFNGGERAGGQKSLFNVVKPSGKSKPTENSEPKLTGRMAEFLGKKDTISPADLAVPLAPKSLPGQKQFFSMGRSNEFCEWLREELFGRLEKYGRASGQLDFGFKSENGHGGQKSFKWREELHPRAADGKFSTEENKGQKSPEAENQAKDDSNQESPNEQPVGFDPEQAVKVAADSIDKLRKPDVYRVIEWTPEEHRGAVAEYISSNRPDLADEVADVSEELGVKPASERASPEVAQVEEQAKEDESEAKPERKSTYINGDRVEYTGQMVDGMHEYEFMEGRRKGETGLTARGPDGSDPYADRNQKQWKEQQSQFARLHVNPSGKKKDEPEPGTGEVAEDSPSKTDSAPVEPAKDEKPDSTQSPRQEATKEVEEDAKSPTVYAYARESAIPNMGEDVLGSARHKRHQWKGLEDAEQNGTADELVTRDNLLKNEPHGLAIYADKNPMVAMAMHYALRALPAQPGYKKGEVGHKEREQYLEVYRLMKSKAEQLAATEQDPRNAIKSLWHDLSAKVRELRGQTDQGSYGHLTATDRYNQTANAIVSMSSAFETFRSRPKANSIIGKTVAFVAEAAKAAPEISDKSLSLEQRTEAFNRVGTAAIAVMSGKSVPEAFGQKGTKSKGFSELAQYVSSAERRGGKDVSQHTTSGEKAAKHLGESYGLRGVQWGNSLTDEERRHHAVKTVEAFTDLADVLGLKPEDVSLGGHVALGVGSRGKGGTAATYWPGKKFINLNRASGVGSLAHEWGHAFDHSLTGFEKMGSSTASRGTGSSGAEYRPAIHGLQNAMESSGYKKRLIGELQGYVNKGAISAAKANNYWLSDHEMFARSFERYVQRKLHKSGAENTYLVGLRKASGGMWPTDDEIDHMAPHFEKLFATYRKKKYGSEEPQKFSRAQLAGAIRMALSGVAEKYRKQYDPNEEGHWVTIDGNHVFIKDANAGEHAKAMGKLHGVRAEHVQHLMPDAHKFLKDQIEQRETAKAHARKLSRLNSGSIGKIENNYRDWSSVDGFDAIARDVAQAHPELGFDPGDTDTPGKVWDLIREGKEEAPAADSKEVAELAAKWLASSKPVKKREVYPEDSVPFSRSGDVYKPGMSLADRIVFSLRQSMESEKYAFVESQHPRSSNGEFAGKGGAEKPLPDRAPWSMSPNELKRSGVKFFRTGQGSIYAHHPTTGQTIRVKSAHTGHDTKDVGLKKPSDRTLYIDPEHARRVGMWQTSSAHNKRIVVHNGHVYLTSRNALSGKQGMDEKPIPFTESPAIGRSPLELNTKSSQTIIRGAEHWSGNHPGSPITQMDVPHNEGHRIITEAAKAAGKPNVYQPGGVV